MRTLRACLPFIVAFSSWGCGSDDSDSGNSSGGAGATGGASGSSGASGSGGSSGASGSGGTSGSGGSGAAAFELTSSAFAEGDTIPTEHVCEAGGGQNVSPPFAWTAGPAGTQSYAIVMRDLDFQSGFLHWAIWDIPAATLSMSAGIDAAFEPSEPAGAKQAPFAGGTVIGYFGPCSPTTVNTYEFTLYALPDATLTGLDENSTLQEAETAIEAAPLGSAKLSGES